jgi:SAM-dependent methyltransferase
MGTSGSFDRVADRYDATRGGERRGHEFAAHILPHLAPGPVFEVGLGTGVVSAGLRALGRPVGGVDVSAPMAKQAYGRLGPVVALGDSRALPVRDGAVANVLFCMVLHLVGDIPATLAEAVRVLAPEGRLVAIHAGPTSEVTDPDSRDILEAMTALATVRARRSDTDLGAAAAAAGLAEVHSGLTDAVHLNYTPRSVADGIRERLWSYLWDLSEDDWYAHVEPALTTLAALPDQDRPRPFINRHRLTVFTA